MFNESSKFFAVDMPNGLTYVGFSEDSQGYESGVKSSFTLHNTIVIPTNKIDYNTRTVEKKYLEKITKERIQSMFQKVQIRPISENDLEKFIQPQLDAESIDVEELKEIVNDKSLEAQLFYLVFSSDKKTLINPAGGVVNYLEFPEYLKKSEVPLPISA